ncbi:flagellin [Endozoicomonadaceae bacterium StTr2]
MLSVNTNTSALMAQNNLSQTQNSLSASMERLSTGLRINSASDDAAGLQISNRMNTQIKGMDVAMRNANDAISMTQTAEGAMVETTNMLNRMRDLSLQAANDSNTAEDRASMQQEVTQLLNQINDTAKQTNFAGIKLLDGNASDLSFQIGSNAGETISFSIGDMSASALKGSVGKATLGQTLQKGNAAANETVNITLKGKDGTADLSVNFTDTDNATQLTDDEIIAEINKDDSDFAKQGITASKDGSGNVVLEGANLRNYTTSTYKSQSEGTAHTFATTTDKTASAIDISTKAGAQEAAQILDGALAQVDKERASLGAIQNRLDYTVANLQNTQENLNTSQSRIKDVDFAKETTNMTKSQMMMQAGRTVLAQTKQMPQYAIQLLG